MKKRLDPRILVKRARILTVAVASVCAVYLGARFDLMTLPMDGCSPVSRYSPGSRLLVDRWGCSLRDGDCVLVAEASGVVHLGILSAAEEANYWYVVGDSADCPGLFPRDEGPVSGASVLGRIVLTLAR